MPAATVDEVTADLSKDPRRERDDDEGDESAATSDQAESERIDEAWDDKTEKKDAWDDKTTKKG
jgi:hypothetical protein